MSVKSISSVSLWLFMYGLSDLFCMGITSILADDYVELFVSWLTIFTILYTILGWVVGEKGIKCAISILPLYVMHYVLLQ